MTLLKTLISPLREKIGDLDPEHYQWSDSWLLDLLENAILHDYNEDDVPQRHEITGSGISRTINPSPTSTEKALMILFAAIRATNAETADAARSAVSYSSSIGSRNMTRLFDALNEQKKRLEAEKDRILKSLAHDEAMDSIMARHISISEPGRSSVNTEGTSSAGDDDLLEEVLKNYP